jgi:glycosyltransferase involved in cell wall biosynthesis
MRIAFVLQYYHPYVGGLESLFRHLAEGLAQRGHIVRVVTIRLPGTLPEETLNNVHIERVRTPRLADRFFFIMNGIFPALKAARQSDILHTVPYGGAIPGYVSAKIAGRPVILTALEVLGPRWFRVERSTAKAAAYQAFEKLLYCLPYNRFAAISNATFEDASALGMDSRLGQVIYCGVDREFRSAPATGSLRKQLGLASDDFIYLYYGRPGITKGVDVLLRAALQVQQAIPNAHLVLILASEPRPQYEALRRLASSLEKNARIHFIPSMSRSELTGCLRDADCIVVPSLTEGFGLTTAEACALGIPVVATRAGSIPEVISGRHVLVDPDSSVAVAEGVIRISRGEWNETPLKSFTWDAMVDAYEQLYKEMI